MELKTMGSRASAVIMAVFYVAIGVLMLAVPDKMSEMLLLILGVISIIIGIIRLIICFAAKSKGWPMRVFDFAVGAVFVAMGIALLILRNKLLYVIPVVFGVFLLISAILKIRDAVDARRFSSSSWGFSLATALIAAVMALILILRPAFVMNLYFRIIGVFLIIDGAASLLSALMIGHSYRRYKKTVGRSVYDTESKVLSTEDALTEEEEELL